MKEALKEARKALLNDEVPVGAVLVKNNRIVSRGHNQPILKRDSTAHAEIIVLRKAGARLSNYRLTGTTLYVTVEPCIMCFGALLNARVKEIIYGCNNEKFGACKTAFKITSNSKLEHNIKIVSGVMEEKCRELLRDFFKNKRMKNRRIFNSFRES